MLETTVLESQSTLNSNICHYKERTRALENHTDSRKARLQLQLFSLGEGDIEAWKATAKVVDSMAPITEDVYRQRRDAYALVEHSEEALKFWDRRLRDTQSAGKGAAES